MSTCPPTPLDTRLLQFMITERLLVGGRHLDPTEARDIGIYVPATFLITQDLVFGHAGQWYRAILTTITPSWATQKEQTYLEYQVRLFAYVAKQPKKGKQPGNRRAGKHPSRQRPQGNRRPTERQPEKHWTCREFTQSQVTAQSNKGRRRQRT